MKTRSPSTGNAILLVEDDRDLASGLKDALELEGYVVVHCAEGAEGLRRARTGRFQLLVLDEMLPGMAGFDLLKHLRKTDPELPVLMLTARGREVDKVRGLKLGADDYVTKPFGLMELMARIEALLRRSRKSSSQIRIGDICVDLRARRVQVRRREINLTVREFEILEYLLLHRGEAVSRDQLIGRIWGSGEETGVTTRTIDQHVVALRRKLCSARSPSPLIETVYGYGYRVSG